MSTAPTTFTPPRLRGRVCSDGERFATFALAADAGLVTMATSAEAPLYVVECHRCVGFHLTEDGTRPGVVAIRARVPARHSLRNLPSHAVLEGSSGPAWRSVRARITRRRLARKRRFAIAEEHIDLVLPRPQVASPAEVDAFFARVLGSAVG